MTLLLVKNWRQEEKGTTEDEMVWWHHWLDGHEFEQSLRVIDGQGSLVCCSPWGCKKSDMTELKWTGDKVSFTLYPNGYSPILGEHYLHVIASAMLSEVTLSLWNTGSFWVVWHMMWTMGIMVICMLSKLFCYEVSSLSVTLFEILCQCIRWPNGKEFACQCRRCWKAGLISESGRSPGGGNGNLLQYSCLENSMDREIGGLQSIGSQRTRHDWMT